MKVLIVGCGNIGAVAAEDLAKSMPSAKIVLADKDEERAKRVAQKISGENVSYMQLDVSNVNKSEIVRSLKGFDLAMGFLPGNLGYNLVESCIKAKKRPCRRFLHAPKSFDSKR
ncbi:MAG: saccharopine dehydrogenase NADP-binding domain-containing protein [Candidatus Bathyarchaeales archaeon]